MEMKDILLFLPLDIQFFADEPPADDTADQPTDEPPVDEQKGKTYTEDELQQIIKDRLSREKKAAEKAIKEAEKLAKMNEEERKQHEFEKLQKELEELRSEKERASLAKEAAKMFSEHDIKASDELLDLVVRSTAEDTQTSVNAVVNIVKELVDAGVKAKLSGTPPKKNNDNKALTKADIRAIKDPIERTKKIAENQHLFDY